MDKTTLLGMLENNNLTLDDLRRVAYEMRREEVADLLVEMYYGFVLAEDERSANGAIYSGLSERWEDLI